MIYYAYDREHIIELIHHLKDGDIIYFDEA